MAPHARSDSSSRAALAERLHFPGPGIDAVVFDLDGVVTDTAAVHEAAWKATLDEFLSAHSAKAGGPYSEFTSEEYAKHIDGKPRYEGAASFIESRGIDLPFGAPSDPPGMDSVCAVANRKNERFRAVLEQEGVAAYPSSVRLLEDLRERGLRTALITSSKNGRDVLAAAGVAGLFDAIIDGNDALGAGIEGKPAADIFLAAAALVGSEPARCAIVEDAQSGVAAGRAGGFAFVLGVDRLGQAQALLDAGAHAVVGDLGDVELWTGGEHPTGAAGAGDTSAGAAQAVPATDAAPRSIAEVPSAIEAQNAIAKRMRGGRPVVFLDYDGTLSPIVDDPAAATMPDSVRRSVERLAAAVPVAIVSGRDLDDVRERAAVDGVHYAGSHGFEIVAPDGAPLHAEKTAEFERYLPALDRAERLLHARLAGIDGVVVERKRFAIAVHFRRAATETVSAVEAAVDKARETERGLHKTGGKKIFELRPGVDWDKGKAVLALLGVPGLGGERAVPMFVGDDLTDEDAFREVNPRGVSVVVRGEDERPTIAQYAVDDPEAAGRLLGYLAESLGDAG